MKRISNQSRTFSRGFFCISIVLLSICISPITNIHSSNSLHNSKTNLSLTPHSSIYITSDSGFEVFPGTGTEEDPYVIEGLNITTYSEYGIYITGTTKFFIVRNCYIDADWYGIYVNNEVDGTVTVIDNTCYRNINYGIWIHNSDISTITNNTCSYNNMGIVLWLSSGSTVANNTCNNNNEGIALNDSADSFVVRNKCNNNELRGIIVNYSSNCTLAYNVCNYNYCGFSIQNSSSSKITKNTCMFTTNLEGTIETSIYIRQSDFCVITYNHLQESNLHGIYISDSDYNVIHHNNFVENNLGETSQAYDDLTTNTWYETATAEGNYWSDWSGTGEYSIDGLGGAIDQYPLDEPLDLDFIPPIIADVISYPSSPTNLDSISISSTVTDSSGVQSVTLRYKVNDGNWIDVSMNLLTGDLYNVSINSFASNDSILFYISAADNSINQNKAINDNSGIYYLITIAEETDITSFPFVIPLFISLFSLIGTVIVQRRRI